MKKAWVCAVLLLAVGWLRAADEVVVRVVPSAAGVPQIRVNGQVVRPRMLWGWAGKALVDQVPLAASNGVDFVSFMAEKDAWRGENDYDWSKLDAACDAILAANPKALLIPRMKLETPGWWAKQHPADVVTYADGSKATAPSIASRPYRRQACAFVTALVRHLCAKYPSRFAGIHPAAQNTSEFFYWESWSKPFCGYDPATQEAFTAWRRAHGRPLAPVPPLANRWVNTWTGTPLADPAKCPQLIDFRRYQQEEMADFVAEVCAAARQASNGKKLVLCFYGYVWTFSGMSNGPAASGHYGLQHLLDRAAQDIDILCSPVDYVDRQWGGTGQVMSATETVMRHGILWLMEDDTRTHLVDRNKCMACNVRCTTLKQSQQVLQRNMAQHLVRGFGSWWMDLGAAGWYAEPALWKVMTGLDALDRALLDRKQLYTPDVAAIVDEDSMCHLSLGRLSNCFVGETRFALARAGAPFGQYLFSDVLKHPLTARLQFFESAWYVTDEQRARVQAQRAANPQVTRVWSWAPGFLTPHGKDLGGVERLTGFKAKALAPSSGVATATPEGLRHGLPASWKMSASKPLVGLLGVEASESETWARFPDGSSAVAVRANGKGGYEVFLGTPTCPTALVRALEDLAGVHRFVRSGDAIVWAAEGVLALSAGPKGGDVVVDAGVAGVVTDALTGRAVGVGPVFTLKMEPGESRVLLLPTFRHNETNG